MSPMNWQPAFIPIDSGLNTEPDPRALQPPELAVCRDAEFVPGGLQTRKPYAALSTNILGGGAVADTRRLATTDGELLLFTKDKLYSWSVRDAAWVLKATHLAAKVTERSMFVNPADQVNCDRAELSGVTFYAWTEKGNPGAGLAHVSYLAAVDTETGAVLYPPTSIGANALRPRLVKMVIRVHLYWFDSALEQISVRSLDPANIATSAAVAATKVLTTGAAVNNYYDVAADSGGAAAYVAARLDGASQPLYGVARLTEALGLNAVNKARTCDGPIAVSPGANAVAIIRANGGNIQGDRLNLATLADITVNAAVGTAAGTVNQIAASYRASGTRHVCFWSSAQTAANGVFRTKSNYLDNAGAVGAEADFKLRLGVASRAFTRDSLVYVWLAFAGESGAAAMEEPAGFRAALQNTYFLFREDGLLVAKAAQAVAGGFSYAASTGGTEHGYLPNVQDLGSDRFAWCGVERRVIPLGGDHTGYAARAPRAIEVQFDSNEARRTVRLGNTLYVTGGEVLQYDGNTLVEVGFHLFPWFFKAAALAGGTMGAGTYALKSTLRSENSKGELDRSTTATHGTVTLGANQKISIGSLLHLAPTHKTGRDAAAIEVWASLVNPTPDAPFYLTNTKDPSVITGANRYLKHDPATGESAYEHDYADAVLGAKETNPENGGILENIAPPPATIIVASSTRLFLAGISHDPHSIWYSKQRGEGEVAAFHDALVVTLPPDGGSITALAFLNETLIAFKERAIYALPGDGFSNDGAGQNYGPPRLLASDVGAIGADGVAVTPDGVLFQSRKGWFMLGRGWQVQYVGGRVQQFDAEPVVATTVLEAKHQIRCATASRVLTWDTKRNQWSEWTIAGALHALIWDGVYAYLASTGARTERSDYTGIDYGIDIEWPWIQIAGQQGRARLRWIMGLGEYRGAHRWRVRVARNYQTSDAGGPVWFDDKRWTPTPATVGGPLNMRHGPKIQECEAFKIRLTAIATDSDLPPTTEAARLTGLGLEIGTKRGLFRLLPAAQTQ